MKKILLYWVKPLSEDAAVLHRELNRNHLRSKRLIIIALFSALAATFQSAGGFWPGVGYLISPFATAPIMVSTIYSVRSGFISYLVTIILLLIIQPSEIIVFPFTTGLLGLGIGIGYLKLRYRVVMIAFSSLCLLVGVSILLYGLQFPVLGPTVSSSFNFTMLGWIAIFSFLYSWLWVDLSQVLLKRMNKMFSKEIRKI